MLRRKHDRTKRLLLATTMSAGLLLGQPGLLRGGDIAVQAAVVADAGVEAAAEIRVPERNPYSDRTQCVYGAWGFAAEHGHKLSHFGNAHSWREQASAAGYAVSDALSAESANSIAVWDRGAGGASWLGHVGWVVAVDGDRFLVRDRNWVRAQDDERWVTWEKGMFFIILQDHAQAVPELAPAGPPDDPESDQAWSGGPDSRSVRHGLVAGGQIAQTWNGHWSTLMVGPGNGSA